MATGLTVNLKLPKGQVESISASSDDTGLRIISLMLPIKEMYSLPEELDILRPDGQPLLLHESLQSQGLRNGSTLIVQDMASTDAKKTWEEEKIVVGPEDLKQQQDEGLASYEDDPLLHPREERDAQARYLKEKANDVLKGEHFAEAIQLYSIALSWLPPEDSDQDLAAALFGNRALAHVKLKDWRSARDDAEQSLLLQPENVKVRYRLGVAERALGNLETARAEFRSVVKRDPSDKTARAALAGVDTELQARQAREAELPEPEVPQAIRWRASRLQQGHALPRFAAVWQQVDSAGPEGTLSESCAAALRHVLRSQPPLERFFHESLAALTEAEANGVSAIVLGAGSCAAASASATLADQRRLRRATVVEPCRLLAEHCTELSSSLEVLRSQGQIDNEFAIPSTAFHVMGTDVGEPPSTAALLCDRLSDDLIGERLLATFAAGLDAARRHLPPKTKLVCVPSRAVLCCAPIELRCDEVAGWDMSKVNALRFSAHDYPEDRLAPGLLSWKCSYCSWFNHPKTKHECELCKKEKSVHGTAQTGPPQRESYGWWPIDLDEEVCQPGICCRACAEEQVVWSYDFSDPDAFSQQRRRLTRRLEVETTCSGRVNAMAVWWRLDGPAGVDLSTRPEWRPRQQGEWLGKRQAVYYFGFEMGVEQGEKLTFNVDIEDGLSRLKFDLISPKLTERMGLVKFEVKLANMQAVQELRRKLDLRTNRLMGPVVGTQLARRDKLIQFGPFETYPGIFDSNVWEKVEDRIRLHVNRPLKGDAPITCVFRHGAFEGTVRWPPPHLANGANVPRLPQYFECMRECHCLPYASALAAALRRLAPPEPRVLELGCGPMPLLALCAAKEGARAWAVEMVPELQELAQEAVRESGLEMVFKYKGYANYSFFGEARRPEAPSVRVMKAMPSTSLRPGITPKFLDGAKAHVIACTPDDGLLGEDYLETMWHAAEQLLEPGGTLLPCAVTVRVAPVQWLALGGPQSPGLLHNRLLAGRTLQASASDRVLPLCEAGLPALRVDLASRPDALPSTEGSVRVEREGTLTGVAFWHEPEFGADKAEDEGNCKLHPSAMVCFLQNPRKVVGGEAVHFTLRFVDRQLQLLILEGQP